MKFSSAMLLFAFVAGPLCRADGLEDRLAPLAAGYKGKVAFAVKRLKTGECFYLNADEPGSTASPY